MAINIPRFKVKPCNINTKCEGAFVIRKKIHGQTLRFYLDETQSPDDKDIVFLVGVENPDEICHEYYITDGDNIWPTSLNYSGYYPGVFKLHGSAYSHSVSIPYRKQTIHQGKYDAILKCAKDWCNNK